MLLRRSLYYAQFPLAVVLPAWVLVSRGILADGVGARLFVYLLLCPVLTLALMVLAGLVVARKSVRVAKAISARDAVLHVASWLTLFCFGLFAFPLLAVLGVLLVIGGFWLVLFELLDETRVRVKRALDLGPTNGSGRAPDVIVVPPPRVSR